jgi:hypothetical protein
LLIARAFNVKLKQIVPEVSVIFRHYWIASREGFLSILIANEPAWHLLETDILRGVSPLERY